MPINLDATDTSTALGDFADAADDDRVAVPIPLAAITRCIQVCGVDAKPEDIAELAANIDDVGLLHPIEVNPNGDGTYTLIKGNSRRLAFLQLKRETIPAFVDPRPSSEELLAEFIRAQASENAHRKHLTILETLNTINRLTEPPCSCGRNQVGRIMRLPETTLKRYWKVHRTLRDRGLPWLPQVRSWLNTPNATWAVAAAFAADRGLERVFAATGELPDLAPADPTTEARPSAEPVSATTPGSPERGTQMAPHNAPAPQPPPATTRGVTPAPTPPTERAESSAARGRRLLQRLRRLLAELHNVAADLPPELREEIRAALADAASRLMAPE
ncbi:ParB/RepB/Spo0J family partition protein [Crossiella cryophila]|uniref:ParB-like chromosome segregation protein Spo0J n=1 Tax=Crossiella cryophila TaxID=43355 RepID=A0A7W7FUA3_9PSEU|nr:ParB N-terminal domain-containing protein [Crossiella cryophila]MBB4677228.1 ParB-like chromosome segregation protein Spo0J [Crossiella cryophila]